MEEGKKKYIAVVKAFDQKLSGEWHSGSCTYYKAKTGIETADEARLETAAIIEERFSNNTERYRFTPCVLAYDEADSQNVEEFFRYM